MLSRLAVIHQRRLLLVAVVGPLLGFAALCTAMISYPGFNQATQYLSELGDGRAPHPAIFNLSVALLGIGAFLAGAGFYFALIGAGGRRIPAILTALLLCIGGIGLITASIFVYPNPLHLTIHLGFCLPVCPILILWSLWGIDGFSALRRFLTATMVTMVALILVTQHIVWPGLVNSVNVGWWERALVVVLVGWVLVVAIALDRRLLRDGYWHGAKPA
ncbi:MAG: hypothetical protein JWP35_275 [Caulobacter sp.]|nr:hypothetical protein [Caulobacter sp.]